MTNNLKQKINTLTNEINQKTEVRQKRIDTLVKEYNNIDAAFQQDFPRDEAAMYLAHERAIWESESDIARFETGAETSLDRVLKEESEETEDDLKATEGGGKKNKIGCRFYELKTINYKNRQKNIV